MAQTLSRPLSRRILWPTDGSEASQRAILAGVNFAREAGCDLIVMASHGRCGLSGLLPGSETRKVLVHSAIPVLVHR